ncbi:nucleotide exchange factor GrpE [Enemella dayhoffiae]|uniref:Protein GrpE n=2 Tax=Enemella dayhoffiae TaxID=2016507 RepID=A0A255GVP5_9ACTN|nr:nucleotide exchange factor GrpE [Enemella dayhoffiae]
MHGAPKRAADDPAVDATDEQAAADQAQPEPDPRIAELEQAYEERTNDLKRLQAEYVNYKRRVDRDRDLARVAGVEAVVADLLPVLDDLRTARQHEELSGGFKLLAEELEKVAGKYGLEAYGAKDEPFDPQLHDALMQAPVPGSGEPTLLDVMQVGYRLKGRVLRPARVAVGMPTGESDAG